MRFIHDKLGDPCLGKRILWALSVFFALFFTCVLLSYFFLPQGLLKGKNPFHEWDTSDNIVVCALQILGFNMISVIVIVISGLFGQKKTYHKNYLSIGYVAFFALICMNAVVLGTWSFSAGSDPVPLFARFLRTFDLKHRAGLWEMIGQLLIVCATANTGIVLTNGKETRTRHIRSIVLQKSEQWSIAAGVILMGIGAVVESLAINNGY